MVLIDRVMDTWGNDDAKQMTELINIIAPQLKDCEKHFNFIDKNHLQTFYFLVNLYTVCQRDIILTLIFMKIFTDEICSGYLERDYTYS